MNKTITKLLIGVLTTALFSGHALALESPENTLNVLDINAARQIALKNSPTIQAVKERLAQAEEVVNRARASYYPSLDAEGTVTKTDFSKSSGMKDMDEKYGTKLSATWLLFSGFNRKFQLRSATYGQMSALEATQDARRLLLLSVAQSYTQVQLARENINTARADITYNTKLLEDTQLKYRVGAGELSDVLNFQVQVNGARASLIDARKEYRIARVGLAAIMGYDSAALPDKLALTPLEKAMGTDSEIPPLERLLQLASGNRPDLKQLNHAVEQAEANIQVARSGYYPKVSLFGSWQGERESNLRLRDDDFGTSVGVNLSMNIFSGGATRARVREANAVKREARRDLRKQEITIREEVTTAWHEIASAREQIGLQKENTTLVRQNRQLVEAKYKAGKTSQLRLTEAQSDLVRTRGLYLKAMANLQLAYEKLKAYTGVEGF